MISALSVPRPKKAFLPAFPALAEAGFLAAAPLLALLLLRGGTWAGASVLGGYALGLLMYGFLYGVVSQDFTPPAKAAGVKKPLPANFGLLMLGKLVVFGGAVAVLLCVLHAAALWMLAGLLLTQAGVTAKIMRWLRDNREQ